MSAQPVIRIRNLGKDFGGKPALSGVNLEILPGSVVGVLGPNGSGKTTLLKHIIGMLIPTRGTVETFDVPADKLDEARVARIGYVSQQSELLDWLTVGETIAFARAHYTTWDDDLAARLHQDFKLEAGHKVGGLSVGQKQRLSILLGIAHRPDLILLDEPAASLDPVVRQDFLDLLMELIQDPNCTILISSHILTDVQKVIDKVLILENGAVHCFADLDHLQEEYFRITLHSLGGELPADLALSGLKNLDHKGATAVATVHSTDPSQVQRELDRLACSSEIRRLDFEEIYRLIITGK